MALERVGADRAGAVDYATPFLTSLGAALFLKGEGLNCLHLISGGFILGGVSTAMFSKRQHQ